MKKLFSILMSVFLIMGCISLPVSPVVEKAEAATKWGIDVSEHQGKINWEKVKASGCDFVIIRCGFGQDKYSQDDDYWEYNSSECERLGIPYGTYLYSYAKNTTAAYSEAQHTLRLLKGKNLSYPVYFDMEDSSTTSAGRSGLAAIAKTYCNTIEAAGYSVGVYANTSWWNTWLTDSCFNNWYRWVAQYSTSCQYGGRYEIWQCTDNWSIPGISGGVDGNYQYADVGGTSTIEEKLETNKNTYAQGEPIYVTASTATADAWVAIYGANDNISSGTSSYYWYWVNGTDTEYGHGGSWTRGQKYNIYDAICSHRVHPNGSMITGSLPAGNYKVAVLHGNYQTLMSKNITISNTTKAPSLEVAKTSFAQGEAIKVKAYSEKTDAWVGLFPGTNPSYDTGSYIYYYYTAGHNDTYVSMQSTGQQNTSHAYKNLPAGTYTLTLFGDNGYGVVDATKTITITGDAMATDKTSYKKGDPIYVTANSSADGSWVGLYKSSETPGNIESLYWYYVKSSADGINRSGQTIKITDDYYYNTERGGSLDAGTYKVYLFGDSGYSNIISSVQFTITNEKTVVSRKETKAATCTTAGVITITYSDGSTSTESIPAKGHMDTIKKVTSPTCTTDGYTTTTCATCGRSVKSNIEAKWGHAPGAAATCTTPQKCTTCNTQLQAALGHKAGAAATCKTPQTCTVCKAVLNPVTNNHTPGAAATCKAPQTCTVCQKVLTAAKAHTPGAAATCTTPQTCTVCHTVIKAALGHKPEAGKYCTEAHECTACHEVFPEKAGEHKLGPAPTCTEPQKCTLCDWVEAPALDHKMAPPTCTEPSKCTRTGCNHTIGTELGHQPVKDEAVAPECIKSGLTEGMHCGRDGCGEVLKAQEVVGATGHAWKDATCEVARQCTNCSIYNGAPLGHSWVEGDVTTAPTCDKSGIRVDTCKNGCGKTNEIIVDATGHRYTSDVTEATCTTDGYTTYTCRNGCGDQYEDDIVPAHCVPGPEATCTASQDCTKCGKMIKPALKHTPGPAPTCTEVQTCTKCPAILAGATGHKPGKAATCTAAQTCTVCKEELNPKKDHTPGKAATCTTAQTCKYCDYVFEAEKGHHAGANATCTTAQKCVDCQKVIKGIAGHTPGTAASCDTPQSCSVCQAILAPATGHMLITVPAVEATCTATGLTEGKVCGTCGDVFVAQATVAKKIHDYEEVVTPATDSKDGVIAEACKYCDKVLESTTFPKIASVKLSYKDTAYTGKKKSPDVVVRDDNDEQIGSEYYTVSAPAGRVNVGTYTYTVTFHGRYAGTKDVELIINPARPESKKPAAAKKSVTVKWKKYTKQVTGYQVMVATNQNFTKNKKSLTIKKATVSSKKVTGLKAKTKYYVKVRSYKIVDGKKYYSRWSDVWNIKTK